MREEMIIVFLTADPKRAAIAYKRMLESEQNRTFWVQTVAETLDMLENYRERLETVHLEHDLAEEGYSHPSSEESGTEIVRWLEKRDPVDYEHVKFIINTWNSSAGKKMTDRLREAGYDVTFQPFGTEVTY
jgi:hypothetical protein